MFRRQKIKPSKPMSVIGIFVGVIFITIGFKMIIPCAGPFGVLWVVMVIAITGINTYNFFSNKGIASWEIDNEENNSDFESRLRKLNKLKEDNLINEEEFKKKRKEIMREKW